MNGAAPPTRPGRSAGSREKTHPTRGFQRPSAKEFAQHGPSSGTSAKKLAQQAKKLRFSPVLGVQGELFRARTHARPSRAKNFAHSTHKHGDDETDDTTARPQQGTAETGITSAPKNCTKTPISRPQRRRRFQSHTDTSKQRRSRFHTTGPPHQQGLAAPPASGLGCDTHGRRPPHLQPNFARNLLRSFFETPHKRCNSNGTHSMFE